MPATKIKVKMDYIGGGFGSKFAADAWASWAPSSPRRRRQAGASCSWIARTEQMIAGNRPSAYAKIKVGGKKDGTITACEA